VVKNRYFSSKENSVEMKDSETQNSTDNQTGDQTAGDQVSTPTEIDSATPTNGQPDIQSADCDNDCANFKNNENDLKYCREVCGDRPVAPKDSESQCENLSGLEKDSCWRDLAVSKKDFAVCDKISDMKLKKVCKNRVTEEILD
jgi:hypothetical protein